MRHLRLSVFLFIASFALASCGGSDSDSDSAPPATGKVAVLFTDGPSEDFEQIIITLDRMLLLGGDGGHQVLYEAESEDERITFDLLDMQDRADFAFASEVLADDYSKIRLEMTEPIQLVNLNGTESTSTEFVDPPANGKIDLNPQGPFTVLPGQTMIVELDIDANRSFQVVETGNPIPRYKLRPVIFVNVDSDNILRRRKLVRVFGTVAEDGVADTSTGQSALICDLHFIPQLGSSVAGNPDDCVRIFTNNENTRIFGAEGLAPVLPIITPDDQLTGIGFLEPDGADALFNLNAVVVEIGPRKSATGAGWETLRGVVETALADCEGAPNPQSFCFNPVDSMTPITTLLQADPLVFDSRGTELDETYIDDNDTGSVDGWRVNFGTEELRAALVVLNPETSDEFVSGLLITVFPMPPYYVLTVDGLAVCVNEETDVLRILVDDESVTIANVIDLSMLVEGFDMVEASGTPSNFGATGCNLIADVVIVESP